MRSLISGVISLSMLSVFFFSPQAPAADPAEDTRQRLELKQAYQDLVLWEMRQLLIAVAGITDGIASNDPKKIAEAARPMGMQAMHGTPEEMRKQLPSGFRQLGRKVHQQMDMIARDAEDLGDPQHSLNQLRNTLQTCVACHAAYRLR